MADIQWLQPGFFALALLALAPWVGPLRTRDRAHALVRSLLVVLIAAALARPVRVDEGGDVRRVLVWDRSASVTATADTAAAEWVSAFLAADPSASTTLVELTDPGRPPLDSPDGVERRTVGGAAATRLDLALAEAARAIPIGVRAGVTVLGDGLATGGDWSRTGEALAARGIPVDWVPLEGAAGDLRPVGLEVVGVARVGTSSRVVARLEGGGQRVDCRLSGADGELAVVEDVVVDGPTSVTFEFEPRAAGVLPVSLEVELASGTDPRPGDGRLETHIAVQAPLRVLYLGERVRGGRDALQDLVGPGFEIGEDDGGLAPGALDRFDLVVLDDVPAASLSEAMQQELVERVQRDGLGLLAAGGEAAFGPGGYHEQPLEALLPVEFVQKEEKRDPSTTLVVIIDTSGSMGGERVQLAKEVSRLAIRRLLPHDKVGIVEFYGAKRWAAPIQPASNSIEIERALNRLNAGGGTVILPAIEEAYYGLKNVRTRYKHVMILTDGGVESGAFEPLLRRMADDGMNVSTVLIGPDAHSEFLVNISNWGKGRFYSVPNRFNLPEILLKQPASAKLPAYRPGALSVDGRGGSGWWGEVDPAGLPALAGYVETRLRPGAELVVETRDDGHPILASWRYGLGRATAMTTEPTGPGTEPWRDWEGYGTLMARTLDRTATDLRSPFAFELSADGDQVVLVAERRGPGEGLPVADDGTSAAVPFRFEQVAPDRYEARRALPSGGVATASAGVEGDDGARTHLALNLARSERQVPSTEGGRLAALVAATGGRLRDVAPIDPSSSIGGGERPLRSTALWPGLALAALLTYLLDLFVRRRPRGPMVTTR